MQKKEQELAAKYLRERAMRQNEKKSSKAK